MKKFLLIFLLLAQPVYPVTPIYPPQYGCITASSGSPIPNSYSLTNTQSLFFNVASGTAVTHFAVTSNSITPALAFSLSTTSTQASPSNSSLNQIVLDGGLVTALDDIKIAQSIMVRGSSTTIGSGTICVVVW